ncbi:MAG: ribonuclease III [Ruminococcaceae bacterium]|nr:ribonuclease III [Oscillospiraceae bacterium]
MADVTDYKNMNGIALAYIGDCVIELEVRTFLLSKKIYDSATLNRNALSFVKASAQSAAFEKIEPTLTEEELSYYKRGRNTHTAKTPKSASAIEYRRATGFEAMFGYLYLSGQSERIKELFSLAYSDVEII